MLSIAKYIDHTILKPITTLAEVETLCKEAIDNQFAAVCVPPYYVKAAKRMLNDSVKAATVIGFPNGYNTTATKLFEIEQAIADGADELDIVHNLAAIKSGDWKTAANEIKACTLFAHKHGKVIKVIVESGSLTDEELIKCCELYSQAGIDYMKTSTGFHGTGATIEAVATMRKHLAPNINIKASGGIRGYAFAKELIDAGANRLGCSASLQILKESVAL